MNVEMRWSEGTAQFLLQKKDNNIVGFSGTRGLDVFGAPKWRAGCSQRNKGTMYAARKRCKGGTAYNDSAYRWDRYGHSDMVWCRMWLGEFQVPPRFATQYMRLLCSAMATGQADPVVPGTYILTIARRRGRGQVCRCVDAQRKVIHYSVKGHIPQYSSFLCPRELGPATHTRGTPRGCIFRWQTRALAHRKSYRKARSMARWSLVALLLVVLDRGLAFLKIYLVPSPLERRPCFQSHGLCHDLVERFHTLRFK